MHCSLEAFVRSWTDQSMACSIAGRFDEVVAVNRDALAVSAANASLSYGALNDAANRVARAILAAVPATRVVAVLVGHDASVVVAMLGVLKAGKMFVALDGTQPAARMVQILEDSEARLLVTDERHLPFARSLQVKGVSLLNMDALDRALSPDEVGLATGPDAPACLLYTSGSTSSPKGVVHTHRTLLQKARTYARVLQLSSEDRLTLLATCSVGQGMSSALLALLNGASLHPFDLRTMGVAELAPWLIAKEITIFISTPSTFRHFARTLTEAHQFAALRAIRLGGERIVPQDFQLYRRHFVRGTVLVGEFASTETGPVTTYVMNHETEIGDVVPAGYPLDGTSVMILDSAGTPKKAGELGEIAVKSPFLASGYWRDPDRTAATFVELPGAVPERLYRTGDLGMLRPDGCLEHRGRKDSRIKIRGYRVEPEEIELALASHPLVREAAVLGVPDRSGNDRLAAYVVLQPEQVVAASNLRAHVLRFLPEHMVPASFSFLPVLPKTGSGKVDRGALIASQTAAISGRADASVKPRDPLEAYLTSVWEDLLEHQSISPTANFFELGGHSLLAARLSASIEQGLGVRLPLAALLKAATIEEQARVIRAQSTTTSWPSLVPIRTGGSKPPLFCMHLADGHVLAYRDLVKYLPHEQPVYGLQSRGLDGTSVIHVHIEKMARDYVAEIRRFQPRGPYAVCGWSFGGLVAFEVARQLVHAGEIVAFVGLFDTYVPGRTHLDGAEAGLSGHVSRALAQLEWLARGTGRNGAIADLLVTPVRSLLHGWQPRATRLPNVMHAVARSNRRALRRYVPQPFEGSLTVFRATERRSARPRDPLLGWGPFACGGIEVHNVPGTHRQMVFEPHARILAERLARCLESAWSREGVGTGEAGRGGDKAA
jgi:amino acid adenylation domain-containing protein